MQAQPTQFQQFVRADWKTVKSMSSAGQASSMLSNAMVEVKTDAAPTHEVANCSPKFKVTPASAVWEPCVVLRTNENTYYV